MKTVFLIDDDGLMRKMMARLLKKEKCRVKTFASPVGVLERMAEESPDLIITDVQMPGMSGLQFLERARMEGYHTPALVMTGFMGPDVIEQARGVGVNHVLQKPIKDLSRLRLLIREALSPSDNGTGLDQLRLEFLTGMSHELRTPLTAIKLALGGLFAEKDAGVDSNRSQLLGISRRNVDRIIRMVEKQLDLLQITLGEVSIARRLVDLTHLVDGAMKPGPVEETADQTTDPAGSGVYLFTDPERLGTAIQCLLEIGGAASDPSASTCAIRQDGREIVIEFRDCAAVVPQVRSGDSYVADGRQDPFGPAGNCQFEFRACRRLVESLGGTVEVAGGDVGAECIALRLPILPEYNYSVDFLSPVRSLRKAAELSDKRVSFFRCDVKGNGAGPEEPNPNVGEFLRRCASALSKEEVLVRGGTHGTYYLALVERKRDEIDDIVEFLQQSDSGGNTGQNGDRTVVLQTIPACELPGKDTSPVPEVVS